MRKSDLMILLIDQAGKLVKDGIIECVHPVSSHGKGRPHARTLNKKSPETVAYSDRVRVLLKASSHTM